MVSVVTTIFDRRITGHEFMLTLSGVIKWNIKKKTCRMEMTYQRNCALISSVGGGQNDWRIESMVNKQEDNSCGRRRYE